MGPLCRTFSSSSLPQVAVAGARGYRRASGRAVRAARRRTYALCMKSRGPRDARSFRSCCLDGSSIARRSSRGPPRLEITSRPMSESSPVCPKTRHNSAPRPVQHESRKGRRCGDQRTSCASRAALGGMRSARGRHDEPPPATRESRCDGAGRRVQGSRRRKPRGETIARSGTSSTRRSLSPVTSTSAEAERASAIR